MHLRDLKPAGSWALYDLANTIFSAIVLTAYFPLYFTEITGSNWSLGAATTISMLLAGLFVPFFGALSDHTGKTKTYLLRTTLLCIAFLGGLGFTKSAPALLTLFLFACFFFHASLVFYNSLLPGVIAPSRQGLLSGIGTGLGYLGVLIALPLAHQIDNIFGKMWVFPTAALLFLLFACPLFFFVPERTIVHPTPFKWNLWKEEWNKILDLMKSLPKTPKLLLFFAGNFFVLDALNSMIFWFLVYAREVFSPTQATLIKLMMGVNASAFLAGIVLGFVTDKWGAMRTFILSATVLTLTLGLLACVTGFNAFIVISLCGGATAIAGIWTAGRKVLIELSPKEQIGEYFGIYGLTTKISVLGSFIFSVTADISGFRTALWVLVFPSVVGLLMLIASARCQDAK